MISDIVLGDGTNPGGVQGSYERRIDLTKPIKGGGVVTAFASYALKVSWDWPKDKSPLAIILPRSVTLLDYQSFMNEKSVTNIVFGSCPTISSAAFTDCGFGQMLWEVPWKSWRTFVEDRTKLIPWESCGATTQAVWRARFSGKVPAGLTVGFGGQWVRFLPNVGMKLIFK